MPICLLDEVAHVRIASSNVSSDTPLCFTTTLFSSTLGSTLSTPAADRQEQLLACYVRFTRANITTQTNAHLLLEKEGGSRHWHSRRSSFRRSSGLSADNSNPTSTYSTRHQYAIQENDTE